MTTESDHGRAATAEAVRVHQARAEGGSRIFIAMLVFGGVAALVMGFRQIAVEVRSASRQHEAPIMGEIPDFSLIRETGQPFTRFDLRDKIWVADFVFTRCAGPCPLMTQKMAELQNVLLGLEDLRFVTFTVDPEHDTPEVLARYAARNAADPDRWIFLTGARKRIYDLCVKDFKLAVQDQSDEDYEHMIIHSTKFVLMDRKGRIRGYFDGRDGHEITKLVAAIHKLAESEVD
jgi:cytochrome oxidase Cu insertion factor (SCO1/SenC/PrrC family)